MAINDVIIDLEEYWLKRVKENPKLFSSLPEKMKTEAVCLFHRKNFVREFH